MPEKAPYKLTIKLDSARPDALGDAMKRLRDIAGDYDQTGEGSATFLFEAWQEAPLTDIREQFEIWLHQHAIGLGCEVVQKSPGLRPETVTALRATQRTPMDDALQDDETSALITPASREPLALPAPDAELIIDGEVVLDDA